MKAWVVAHTIIGGFRLQHCAYDLHQLMQQHRLTLQHLELWLDLFHHIVLFVTQ
jgi:hypothetical protein